MVRIVQQNNYEWYIIIVYFPENTRAGIRYGYFIMLSYHDPAELKKYNKYNFIPYTFGCFYLIWEINIYRSFILVRWKTRFLFVRKKKLLWNTLKSRQSDLSHIGSYNMLFNVE